MSTTSDKFHHQMNISDKEPSLSTTRELAFPEIQKKVDGIAENIKNKKKNKKK